MSPDQTTEAPRAEAAVAPGVYRFGSGRINWYVVEEDDEVAVVDAGLPGHWEQLRSGLDDLGYELTDVSALVLTHAHPDHVGFAERLRTEVDVPVLVHEADAAMARGEGPDAALGPMLRALWRPAVIGLLVELARGGGTSIPPIETVETFADGDELDLPGRPRAIHVPGHSAGSCALFLEDRDVLLAGDALATLDIKTGGRRGPQLMPLFNEDVDRARESLDRLEDLGHVTLLPGHGAPWDGDAADAVAAARRR